VVLDQLLGDPRRGHPVAVFGAAAGRLDARMWRDERAAGVGYTAVLAGASALLGLALSGLAQRGPAQRGLAQRGLAQRKRSALWLSVATAAGTWAVLGARSLADEADAVADCLHRGDLPAARRQLTHLVGRRTDSLDEAEIARATIESVAENTCDATVAPLLWGAVAGLPGLLAYRAVNTLDAMVGYRSPRYQRFGWAAARLDDLANLVPARLAALLTTVCAPVVGGSAAGAWRAWRRDASAHPSPNAGQVEAAFAGALEIRLGGRVRYAHGVEERPVLGDGRTPDAGHVTRAVELSRLVGAVSCVLAAVLAVVVGRRPVRTRRR
jgi:adenosylcobinamide-phosphate synthase